MRPEPADGMACREECQLHLFPAEAEQKSLKSYLCTTAHFKDENFSKEKGSSFIDLLSMS